MSQVVGASVTGNTSGGILAGTERVSQTTGLIEVPRDSTVMIVWGTVEVTLAAGVTAVQVNLRRGALANSPLVSSGQNLTSGWSANTLARFTVFAIDILLLGATVQYSLSVLLTTAGGTDGTCTIAALAMF